MNRPRTTILIGILVLVNVLVFGSLLVLLVNAVNGGSTNNAPASTPRTTSTPTLAPTTSTTTATPTRVVGTPAVAGSTVAPSAATPSSGVTYPFTYTVQAGDSISVIAKRFNVPAAKIMAANNISNADFIKVGQVLIIPDPNK